MSEELDALPETASSAAAATVSPVFDGSPAGQGGAAIPTTCIETIGGDPGTALRLSFQIKVF